MQTVGRVFTHPSLSFFRFCGTREGVVLPNGHSQIGCRSFIPLTSSLLGKYLVAAATSATDYCFLRIQGEGVFFSFILTGLTLKFMQCYVLGKQAVCYLNGKEFDYSVIILYLFSSKQYSKWLSGNCR
jgi:hypothetical protein